jgi:hypothetical protein
MSVNTDYMMVFVITVGMGFSTSIGVELGKFTVEILKTRMKRSKEKLLARE